MESVTQGTRKGQEQSGEPAAAVAGVIQVDPGKIESYLSQKVRESVEETLNTLLEEEADRVCGAKRYQRSEERADTRAGHYKRKLLTKADELELEVPRLRKLPLETAIIERYRRTESSVEEALIEMYLAGVSVRRVAAMLKAIHAQEDRPAAREKAHAVIAKLTEMKLSKAAELMAQGVDETLSYYAFPREHWRCLRTNNPMERLNREIRRRTRVVGNFSDGNSALMLVAARLRHVADTRWGTRRYLDMSRLREPAETLAAVA